MLAYCVDEVESRVMVPLLVTPAAATLSTPLPSTEPVGAMDCPLGMVPVMVLLLSATKAPPPVLSLNVTPPVKVTASGPLLPVPSWVKVIPEAVNVPLSAIDPEFSKEPEVSLNAPPPSTTQVPLLTVWVPVSWRVSAAAISTVPVRPLVRLTSM